MAIIFDQFSTPAAVPDATLAAIVEHLRAAGCIRDQEQAGVLTPAIWAPIHNVVETAVARRFVGEPMTQRTLTAFHAELAALNRRLATLHLQMLVSPEDDIGVTPGSSTAYMTMTPPRNSDMAHKKEFEAWYNDRRHLTPSNTSRMGLALRRLLRRWETWEIPAEQYRRLVQLSAKLISVRAELPT